MKRFGINQDVLKIVALLLMTIDHIGTFFAAEPYSQICRYIGRASYPIFAYLLMMNLASYQIFGKYLKRLGYFGFITFFAIVPIWVVLKKPVAFPSNILVNFWIVVAALYLYHEIEKLKKPALLQWLLFLPVFAMAGACSVLSIYGFLGFCLSFCLYFYFYKGTFDWLALSLLFSYLINASFMGGFVSLFTMAFLLFAVQIKTQPRYLHHWWIFYVYYPLHIVVLALIYYFV